MLNGAFGTPANKADGLDPRFTFQFVFVLLLALVFLFVFLLVFVFAFWASVFVFLFAFVFIFVFWAQLNWCSEKVLGCLPPLLLFFLWQVFVFVFILVFVSSKGSLVLPTMKF